MMPSSDHVVVSKTACWRSAAGASSPSATGRQGPAKRRSTVTLRWSSRLRRALANLIADGASGVVLMWGWNMPSEPICSIVTRYSYSGGCSAMVGSLG